MKQSPRLADVQARMAPGRIVKEGFLGSDTRSLAEIIDADRALLAALDLTAAEVGHALCRLAATASAGLGAPVAVEGIEARALEAMGRLPCPFGHPGLLPKTVIEATRADGLSLRFAELSAHLIADHGFFGGRGSAFRLDPVETARFLGLA